MSAQEAARFLGAHVETVRRLARRGELPAFKVGKDWRFRIEALRRWTEGLQPHRDRPRILVLDDDAAIRELIQYHLTREGYEVLQCGNGQDGLSLLQSQSMDLVLLDLKMPGMNGGEVMRQMQVRGLSLPVIIITGYPDSDLVMEAMSYGPITLLAKPLSKSMLLKAVRTELREYLQPQAR